MSKHKHTRRQFLGRTTMGCASLGLTSLFSGITNMGLMNAAAAANRPFIQSANNYKALVCIMLNGGNDSYNMLVPRGASEYAEYATIRTNLALEQSSLLPINPLNSDGKSYGLHPNLGNIQTLFESGDAAFVANVGALVQPTTLADFQAKNNLPVSLFSHSDQRLHWQTSVPQDTSSLGWAGRLGDILFTNNQNQDISMNISLNGINVFQRGNLVKEYAISPEGTGSILINGYDQTDLRNVLKRQTLDNMLDQTYNNILETAYSNTVDAANSNSLEFSSAIASGTPITTSFGTDSLSQRLLMVARTIAARDILGVSNQTFFVELGGFDTHNDFLTSHADLMTQLDAGISSFYNALVELGVSNDVTSFTMSDFSRKLVSNGDGSDHAWGGHSLVIGGAVEGQKIYGQYPDLYLGNPLDTGSGRIIPTTSCDEYFAELALWFGASSADIDQILPNINNFWTPVPTGGPLGFMG